MDNSKVVYQLCDAVDLIKMLEHIAEMQHDNARQVPWGGIRLTLFQARDLVSSALEEFGLDDVEGQNAGNTRALPRRRRNDNRASESIVNPSGENTEGNRGGNMVRELVDSNSSGTFNRLQLPREANASGDPS
jgi:hypothetical protein